MSEFVGRGLLVVAQVITARSLGPEQFGLFTPVFVGASLLWVVLDLGHDRLLIKATASRLQNANALLLASLAGRIGAGTVALVLAVGLVGLGILPLDAVPMAVWAATEAAIRSVRASLVGQLRAPTEAVVHISQRVLTLVCVYLLARDSSSAASAFALANVVAAALTVASVARPERVASILEAGRSLVTGARSLFLVSLLNIISGQSEIFWLVAFVREAVAIAFYRSATQILFAFLIPAQVLSTVGLTVMSRQPQRQHAARALFGALLIAGLGCGLAMAAFASPIIRVVFGPAYEGAEILALPFAATILLAYVNWGFVTLFIARGRANAVLRVTVVGAIASVIGNVTLVPRWGIVGSGTARALTEFSMTNAFAYLGRAQERSTADAPHST
ncbi:MAG: oligosaccharide flippase family protein [Chloroflexota bacterium]|nr:oligosaccharide flippase family protein [Chloroflexota bacterium]